MAGTDALSPTIDFTAREFTSAKQALVQYLQDRFSDSFTDFTESQLGIAILELSAYLFANQAFYLDRAANESYLATARQRRNVVLLARNVGYVPFLATAASVDVVVDTTGLTVSTGDILSVAKKQKLTSTGGVVFEILADHTLVCTDGATKTFSLDGAAPSTTVTLPLSQGESKTSTSRSNGQPFQTFVLDQFPVISDSVHGYVGGTSSGSAGVEWTQVDALPLGNPDDVDDQQIFAVAIDENDKATVKFGDNITGAVPAGDEVVSFDYRIGGGTQGNIAANTLSGSLSSVKNGTSVVSLKVANTAPGGGGQDRESTASIKFFAPLWVKTNDRAITENDYFTLSNGYTDGTNGSIAKAGVICDPSDGLSNVVTVYAWTKSSANVLQATTPTALKASLLDFLVDRKVVTVYVQVVDGVNVPIDVTVLLRIDSRFASAAVAAAVQTQLTGIFQEDRVRYGNELRLSWIYEEVMAVPGVSWCHVTSPQCSVETGTARDLAVGTLGSQSGANSLQFVLPTSFGAASALGTSVSATDGAYCNYRVDMLTGNQAGQTRKIVAYVGSTRIATVDNYWPSLLVPSVGSTFRLWHPRSIALATAASSTTGHYARQVLSLTANTGNGQTRNVRSYDGGTRIATVDKNWTQAPDSTSGYTIFADLKCAKNEALVLGSGTVTVISNLDES